MKLEVGMYVITTDRKEIGKIIGFCECEMCKERGYYEPVINNPNMFITIYDKERKFHGYKFYKELVNLIEVGDYVNGKQVIKVSTDYIFDYSEEIKIIYFSEEDYIYSSSDIKSIVTKEQFESMSYKVGE